MEGGIYRDVMFGCYQGREYKYKGGCGCTFVNMAAACGLQSVQEVLLFSFFEDTIDDVEFMVLYEENYSREIFPYWKYDKFHLDGWDDAECKVELRFEKSDLAVLLRSLRFPDLLFALRGRSALVWKVFAFC